MILSKSSYFIRSFKSSQVIMFIMFYRIWSMIHQDLSCFYQINLISFSCLHLCLTVPCTTPGLNAELLGRILNYSEEYPADSGLDTVTNMEMCHFMSRHMFTIRFIRHFKSCSFILSLWSHVNACVAHVKHHLYKKMLRTHPQTPSHFKAHKACTAESQPFPQAYVCLALTFKK